MSASAAVWASICRCWCVNILCGSELAYCTLLVAMASVYSSTIVVGPSVTTFVTSIGGVGRCLGLHQLVHRCCWCLNVILRGQSKGRTARIPRFALVYIHAGFTRCAKASACGTVETPGLAESGPPAAASCTYFPNEPSPKHRYFRPRKTYAAQLSTSGQSPARS